MKTTLCKILMIVLSVSLTLTPLDNADAAGRRKLKISTRKDYTRDPATVKKIAKQIATGHAYKKHRGDFPVLDNLSQRKGTKKLTEIVQKMMPKAKTQRRDRKSSKFKKVLMHVDLHNQTYKKQMKSKKNKQKTGRRRTDLGTIYSTDPKMKNRKRVKSVYPEYLQ